MRRILLHSLAALALLAQPVSVFAQGQPIPSEAPEPKMPPMPSMEGQQGDVSKPVTQIPTRRKAAPGASGAKVGAPGPKPKAAKARSSAHRNARPHPNRGRRRR